MVQGAWVRRIRGISFNRSVIGDTGSLDEFLFGTERASLREYVPILKKYQGNAVFLKLNREFREKQAKKNIVGLNARLTCWIPR